MDERVPVANRYFGVFQDGSLKVRGIEVRRRDTPPWVAETQNKMLMRLSHAATVNELPSCLTEAFDVFRAALSQLRAGKVPLEKLVITGRVSHELESYRSPTPAARAAMQILKQTGKHSRPGQKVRFLFTLGEDGVRAWELPGKIDPDEIDRVKYTEMLARAAASVFHPFGIRDDELKQWAHTQSLALNLGLELEVPDVRKIYHNVGTRRIEGIARVGGIAR
jgi:DNA polymerase-2